MFWYYSKKPLYFNTETERTRDTQAHTHTHVTHIHAYAGTHHTRARDSTFFNIKITPILRLMNYLY